jgi:lysyl endopeptidase
MACFPRCLLAALLLAAPASAYQQAGPLVLPDSTAQEFVPAPPMRLAEGLSAAPLHSLGSASEGALDQLDAMKAWNTAGNRPVQNGFARPLREPVAVRLDAGSLAGISYRSHDGGFVAESFAGNPVWGTSVRVAESERLRLHLTEVSLPAGTRLWVWGLGEEPRAFGLELLAPDGDLWTPSAGGETIFLEVELPAGSLGKEQAWGFQIREIVQTYRLGRGGQPLLTPAFEPVGECLNDGSCYNSSHLDVIELYRKAVAQLEYIKGGQSRLCSGGLLNDQDDSTVIPYFLTANHCFDTQAVASTLEAFWDNRTSSCGGSWPNPASLPRSNGAILLATSPNSDFTFLRLHSIPAGRVLLGWSAQTPAHGTVLHRLSHPAPEGVPFPQAYSRAKVDTSSGTCSGFPRTRFTYSRPELGGAFGGSSGSPVILAGGIVVGQLLGGCGPDPHDGCNYQNMQVDGAFATTYPSVAQYLNAPVSSGPCVPNATTLCIDDQPGDKRFQVTVSYQTTQGGGLSGPGTAIPLNGLGVTAGGLFWFFDAKNPEMLVKVLNGCAVTGDYWVFYAAGTNVGLTTTVLDTQTGRSKVYTNPDRNPAPPVQDLGAFACN